MANTPTREHREAAAKSLYPLIHSSSRLWRWVDGSDDYIAPGCDARVKTIAQSLADAEQRGFERGLADRDERCLQSDMQRIRERLAFERGRETGAAPFDALFEAGYMLDTTMPTEADGYATRSLHVGLKTARAGTWFDAARDLCAELGLNLTKDGE